MTQFKIDRKAMSQLITQTQSNFTHLVNTLPDSGLLAVIFSALVFIVCLWLDVSQVVISPHSLEGSVVYQDSDGERYILGGVSFSSSW